jgi:hypothetical protein
MYFKYDKQTNTLETSDGYWIPVDELNHKDANGRYFWFSHLVQKYWFDQAHAAELLNWCEVLNTGVDIKQARIEMAEDRQMIQLVIEKLGGAQ